MFVINRSAVMPRHETHEMVDHYKKSTALKFAESETRAIARVSDEANYLFKMNLG